MHRGFSGFLLSAFGALILGGALLSLPLGCSGSRSQSAQGTVPTASASSAASAPARSQPPLIGRRLIFGNPDKESPRISPDGKKIAFLAPRDGVLNVWVAPIAEPEKATPVTSDKVRGIRNYHWTYTNQHLLYLQDKGGDENWRIYRVNLGDGTTTDLTPIEKVQARLQSVSHKHPREVLIGLNDRDPRYHDIYRVALESGKRTLLVKNDGFADFVTDEDYQVRFAVKPTKDGGNELLQRAGNGWKPFITIPMDDALTTAPQDFDKSGKLLYMLDSRERDTAALVSIEIASGKRAVVADDPQADVSQVRQHPTEKTLQAVSSDYTRRRWHVLDPALNADFEALKRADKGDFEIVSGTLDDRHWIVGYTLDTGPVHYHHYDRQTKTAAFLFSSRKELESQPLAEMLPVVIKARDGLSLVSYLTLPIGTRAGTEARPAAPLPMVLFVHGGPWGRDSWGYNAWHQWLANRGYAVLSVNYRGSTGFGKRFVNAGNKEWARRMHDDLVDAVRWAEQNGIAAKGKVAIMGGSYGGYATLVGLTFTPELFTCGVDIVGPSNLVTLLKSIPPYWEAYIETFAQRVGDHRTDQGQKLLMERSPLTRVDRISRPLLIGQGANDPRVKQAESDQIVQAMQKKKIPVTYVLYPDEGHGFVRPENRLSFNAVAEAFLSRCLGGRAEPIGDAFQGSSISVPEGSGEIAGLKEALAAQAAKPPAPR